MRLIYGGKGVVGRRRKSKMRGGVMRECVPELSEEGWNSTTVVTPPSEAAVTTV